MVATLLVTTVPCSLGIFSYTRSCWHCLPGCIYTCRYCIAEKQEREVANNQQWQDLLCSLGFFVTIYWSFTAIAYSVGCFIAELQEDSLFNFFIGKKNHHLIHHHIYLLHATVSVCKARLLSPVPTMSPVVKSLKSNGQIAGVLVAKRTRVSKSVCQSVCLYIIYRAIIPSVILLCVNSPSHFSCRFSVWTQPHSSPENCAGWSQFGFGRLCTVSIY